MMIPKQKNSTAENWFSSIPYQAKATGVLTICIGTAFSLLYFFDQYSKISTTPVGTNPNSTPNPRLTNTDLSSPLEINTSNPNSNLPTLSNTKPPFSTPNSPGQSLTPFTNNSNNILAQSNPNSNINPNTGINPQTQQNISTTNIPELDKIVATQTQQNPQVIPPITPQNNREIGRPNINTIGRKSQIIYPVSRNKINRQPVFSTQIPPGKIVPTFSDKIYPRTIINQINNNQSNRNIQTKPTQNTNTIKEQPQNTTPQNINSDKIESSTNPTTLNKTGTNPLNINDQNNSINNNTSINTQTNTNNIVVTTRKSVLPTLPPNPPVINPQSNDNLSSNINNNQFTPPTTSKSESSQKIVISDLALKIPPLPPSPNKIVTFERVKNDSVITKNSEEILIENPDQTAINNHQETPPSNIIIPQVKEVKDYLQTRWKVPEGLNQTIEYIVVLDSDGTIKDIQGLGETAKKYRETTNIPAPGDKFVSPLSLGKLPKIRVVFAQDGKVQTFLEDE